MTNTLMRLLATTVFGCFAALAHEPPAAAQPRVTITGATRVRTVDHRESLPAEVHPPAAHQPWLHTRSTVRPVRPLEVVAPREHLRPRVLAARVTRYLGWSEAELVPYLRGSMRHRRELERVAQELLADAAASAVQRQMAEDLLQRLRRIPPVIVVE